MIADRYLLIRAASIYATAVVTALVWIWRRPSTRAISGAVLGFVWNLPAVLLLMVAGTRAGWWQFDATGGLLLGVPVDLYLAWAWLWGAIPALAFPRTPIAALVVLALGVDLLLMPATAPVVRLEPGWLAGEAVGLAAALVPAQLLARWTATDRHLAWRATLQTVTFAGLMGFIIPAIVIQGTASTWRNPLVWPAWQLNVLVQVLALPGVIGLTAVQEFVTRGGGTPVPFDPPRRIVTSGIYAYVRNPMQLSAVLMFLLLGFALWNPWIAAAGVMAHLYAVGFAGADEESDLQARFGPAWTAYRTGVPKWFPRIRPWHAPGEPPSRLFVAQGCDVCRDVAAWFDGRGASQLTIIPAEDHPSGALRRITYEPGDGSRAASGIEAIARAVEHISIGWALAGFALRLPLVLPLVQLLADASGAGPRTLTDQTCAVPRRRASSL